MYMIEIYPLANGAHNNQTVIEPVPNGWAIVPEDMETENFPFGNVEVAEIDGVMTVTSWTPLPLPAPIPVSPSEKRRKAYTTGEVDGTDWRIDYDGEHKTCDELTLLGMQYYFRNETEAAAEIRALVEAKVGEIRAAYPDENPAE